MPCYTIKSGDTVARVHSEELPSDRSQKAIRDVIAAAGRMMSGECENCGEPADGKSVDEVPLCARCAAEIRKAYRDEELREERREDLRRDAFGDRFD